MRAFLIHYSYMTEQHGRKYYGNYDEWHRKGILLVYGNSYEDCCEKIKQHVTKTFADSFGGERLMDNPQWDFETRTLE